MSHLCEDRDCPKCGDLGRGQPITLLFTGEDKWSPMMQPPDCKVTVRLEGMADRIWAQVIDYRLCSADRDPIIFPRGVRFIVAPLPGEPQVSYCPI